MFNIYIFVFFKFLFSQTTIDGVVAVVGDNIILHSEILQQTHMVAASRGINLSKSPYLFETIYDETLKNQIDQYVVFDVAEKDTNIVVLDEEVDRALDQRIDDFVNQAGSKELFEEMAGMSLRQVRSEYWPEIQKMLFIEKYKFSKMAKDNNELYGSIKPKELSKTIETIDKIEIKPSQIDLSKQINKVGFYEAMINLHSEIQAKVHIEVVKKEEEN